MGKNKNKKYKVELEEEIKEIDEQCNERSPAWYMMHKEYIKALESNKSCSGRRESSGVGRSKKSPNRKKNIELLRG